ncbi:MAG TPA: class I SAM-dependent methyltransferase [Anaerolineales bacterium]|nr:class I SAM-dependent methyltransferase [Anaerolineales bacterium]
MNDNPGSARPKDNWANGDLYERYVGRWSRPVAREFLKWLAVPAGSQWLDVGCGTGALSQTILEYADPAVITAIDRSEEFVAFARAHTPDHRIHFEVGDAQALSAEIGIFDAVVSGLVLNFIPNPDQALTGMRRVARKGGIVGAYVWDYAAGMQLMRHFWDAAVALDPHVSDLDEVRRFPLSRPEPLNGLFQVAGFHQVEVIPIEVPTDFRDFDDYWSPFLGGQGPAPSYAMSLGEEARSKLRKKIREGMPIQPDGSIHLKARAWSIKGTC